MYAFSPSPSSLTLHPFLLSFHSSNPLSTYRYSPEAASIHMGMQDDGLHLLPSTSAWQQRPQASASLCNMSYWYWYREYRSGALRQSIYIYILPSNQSHLHVCSAACSVIPCISLH
jgi:hypothetical protein